MTTSSSEGTLPATSAGSAGSSGGRASPAPHNDVILVSKVLTYSDVSVEVARTGRIVLPRIQVQQCLPELLQLCQAGHALPAVRSGGPVKLSVDLEIVDEAGRTWVLLLKTWQNVVSGEHRPTFVLENTADFVRANGLAQGDTLAFCPRQGRMLVRTSLRPDQLPPRRLKRASGAAAGGPAAKRRALAVRSPPAASTPEPPARSRRKQTASAGAAPLAAFWQPSPAQAVEAAAALLQMHSAGSSHGSEAAGAAQPAGAPPAGAPPSPLASTCTTAAAAAEAAGSTPAALAGSHPIFRPQPLQTHAAPAVAQQQQQQQAAAAPVLQPPTGCSPQFGAGAAALPAAYQPSPLQVLPLTQPPSSAGAGGVPPGALAQARAWLAGVLAQQEQERRLLEQYHRLLLLQALQEEHQRRLAAGLGRD
ncbi:hypothetical protein ABPG77_009987 [Micractinium sp. CCAP 211/92]